VSYFGEFSINEIGDRQVTLDEPLRWWHRLLRLKPKQYVLVQDFPGTVWWHKGSGIRAGTDLEWVCQCVVENHRQRTKAQDRKRQSQKTVIDARSNEPNQRIEE
jgi:hypothetical protein